MSRKSKAKQSDGFKASKKMKVSEENVDVVLTEEEVDEGPWDGIRVIGGEDDDEEVLCRSDGCGNKATATWASQKTGDEWDMCDKCQLEDFGECFTGTAGTKTEAAIADMPPPSPKPMDEDKNEETLVDPATPDTHDPTNHLSSESKVADKTEESQMKEHEGKPHDSPHAATANPSLDEVAAPNEVPPPTVSDDSSPSESPSVASSDDIGGKYHDTPPSPSTSTVTPAPAITQTQDDSTMVDGNEDSSEDAAAEDEEDEGQYDLKKILSLQDLMKDDTICCSQDACGGLPAFGMYINSIDPKDRWYYCLDCQQNDFGGWPSIEELPIKHLEPEHCRVMARKCSSRKNPPMPAFPSNSLSPKGKPNTTNAATSTANFVTPPPNSLGSKEHSSGGGPVAKANTAGKTKALEIHKKWLEAAQAMGGKDVRIVVGKPAAKKLIFDFLYDAFQPMNITQIYKGLKAVVPQVVLNSCLQEMVPDTFDGKNPFDDSDDEDDAKDSSQRKKEHSEAYTASLVFKAGRALSTNLYFVDYNKIKGMDREEREILMNELAMAKAEEQALKATLQSTKELTVKLLAEPTNEELTLKLEGEESQLRDLEEQVEEARKLKVNEKHKEKTKKSIQTMATHWRQRRRLCLEFLTGLEENTDGAVSRSKCLKGDGQIALDSDEAVADAAVKYAKDKRAKAARLGSHQRKYTMLGRGVGQPKAAAKSTAIAGLESDLVAVKLDAQLNVVRVYSTEDYR